jgi:hypothetical protein
MQREKSFSELALENQNYRSEELEEASEKIVRSP